MSEPQAYLNGQLIAASQLAVPVSDAGFVQGATVSEQLRTFAGRLFRLEQHLDRLQHSLEVVGVDPGLSRSDLAGLAEDLAARNHRLLAAGDDLGLSLFVTPGPYATFAPPGEPRPTVCLHTYPLPFHLWSTRYTAGQSLVTTDIQQVPAECWPPELKCRSRMHYFLADRRARQIDPTARAVMLDRDGSVVETSTANLVIYRREEGFVSPPREKILPGVSVAVLEELAATIDVPFGHRDLLPADLETADEVILSSTSPCLLPVISLDGKPIADGRPGEQFRRALAAWSRLVGVDIPGQADRFSRRSV